jgi:ubiquilin
MLQQVLRDPEMRRMMFSPEMMRMQLQMQRSMGGRGPGAAPSFPAPGATDNTPQSGSTATGEGATATPNQTNTTTPPNPFAAFGEGAAAGAGANPFASLFAGGQNPFAPQQQQGANTGAPPNTQDASSTFPNLFGGAGAQGGQTNPIAEAAQRMMQNPEAMRNMMQMMGGGSGANPLAAFGQDPASGAAAGGAGQPAAGNPFAALFGPGGFGSPPPPADNRPPEEVYETQLRQLNEMGFYEFDRNVSALRRSGGNVQGAIEYLLNGTV